MHGNEISGKVAFITGAGSGIGRAAALGIAQQGARVALIGQNCPSVEETAHLIEKAGGAALAIRCDVANENEVQAAVACTANSYGRLDFAFNNAAKQGGVIVNTSSTAGVRGFARQASYVAAKHGVIGLSKVAALDYASDNVRVNVIAPGLSKTKIFERMTADNEHGADQFFDRIPLGRPGEANEIASTFLWLCSDAATYTTGAVFVIDGGLTI
uniref:2,5-dichloro-2,5-cyclohexadiene-1,4-diol dehydrogenase-like n=1 Tax=Drosophila rhopaloa TaxID=1041015 RepID=A0A6P4FAC2_DRORH